MESKNNYNVELLNNKNYHNWKFRMITLLTEKEVITSIYEEFKEESFTDSQKQEMLDSRKMDNKCKSIIIQCLNDSQLDIVREKGTAYSIWKSLEQTYEKKGLPGQLMLRRKLISMKLKEDEDLEQFLSEFEETVRQLKASGAEIKEEDLICTLLLSLPKSFETLITVLESMPQKQLKLETVKSKLRAEVEKRKATSVSVQNTKSAAFLSNQPGACYFCGERGHYKRECQKCMQCQRGQSQRG